MQSCALHRLEVPSRPIYKPTFGCTQCSVLSPRLALNLRTALVLSYGAVASRSSATRGCPGISGTAGVVPRLPLGVFFAQSATSAALLEAPGPGKAVAVLLRCFRSISRAHPQRAGPDGALQPHSARVL